MSLLLLHFSCGKAYREFQIPKSQTQLEVQEIIDASDECKDNFFPGRGKSPVGYFNGMAWTFVKAVCRGTHSKENTIYSAMIQKTQKDEKDALLYYSQNSKLKNENLYEENEKHLVATFSLLHSLGMMESTGKYSEGADRAVKEKRKSSEIEAGLFQISENSTNFDQSLKEVYEEYSKDRWKCFLNVFKEGVSKSKNSRTIGGGRGAHFQSLMKRCPAFAVEYAAVLIRFAYHHFGPLKSLKTREEPACREMYSELYGYLEGDQVEFCTALGL